MASTLDLTVNRALSRLRVVERALHEDDGLWTIQAGSDRFLARVEVVADSVIFRANLPGSAGSEPLGLWCNDDFLAARPPMGFPNWLADDVIEFEWSFEISVPAAA